LYSQKSLTLYIFFIRPLFFQCISALRFAARSGQHCSRFFPTGYVQVYDMARTASTRFSAALRLAWHIGLLPSCSCATRRVNQKSCCNLRPANQTLALRLSVPHTVQLETPETQTPYSGFSCITPISLSVPLERCLF